MFNYVLVAMKGTVEAKRFELELGESKKGTYKTLSGKAGNKAIPFGKIYVDETQMTEKPAKATKKS